MPKVRDAQRLVERNRISPTTSTVALLLAVMIGAATAGLVAALALAYCTARL